MISDNQTNTVYFSELLNSDSRYSATCKQITKILDSYKVSYNFLEKTKDIWARDYMPIQVSDNKFVEYRYDPDYLQGKEKGYRDKKTYPDIVCDWLKLETMKTDIILDGGNVIKSKNYVVLTDKIVTENQHLCKKTDLIKNLEELFEVDHIVLIPWPKAEEYGHSDGMLRFIDEKTVLINEVERFPSLERRLKEHGLNWEYLHYNVEKENKYYWAYINFLQTKDLLLLPKFNADEDEQAFEQIKKYYPDYAKDNKIAQVEMTEIAKYDGALNCISWTIKTK